MKVISERNDYPQSGSGTTTKNKDPKTMPAALDYFVVEFSHTQNTFNISTLDDLLKSNLESVKEGKQPDYFPIYCSKDSQKCEQFAEQLKRTLQASMKRRNRQRPSYE